MHGLRRRATTPGGDSQKFTGRKLMGGKSLSIVCRAGTGKKSSSTIEEPEASSAWPIFLMHTTCCLKTSWPPDSIPSQLIRKRFFIRNLDRRNPRPRQRHRRLTPAKNDLPSSKRDFCHFGN